MEHSLQNQLSSNFSINRKVPDPNAKLNDLNDTTYHLEIQLRYKAPHDSLICIMGEIPELGCWKEKKCWMRNTDGDFWITERPIITNRHYFRMKFAVVTSDRQTILHWEKGIDRVNDLELLP